jgi:hypothetical protein
MAVAWLGQYHRTSRVTGPMDNASAGESGQRTALSTPNNAIFNDHPRDAAGAELACAYYGRRLRPLSFPGNSPCCSRSCCLRYRLVSQVVVEAAGRADVL